MRAVDLALYADELASRASTLAAQTTDVAVNRVTERLFLKYRRPEDYLLKTKAEIAQARARGAGDA
jgi:endonuclease III